jgi:hypothetical protein
MMNLLRKRLKALNRFLHTCSPGAITFEPSVAPPASTPPPEAPEPEPRLRYNSVEEQPWEHPFLTGENICRFRAYSLAVREAALAYHQRDHAPLDVAFCINLAQNTYKWARMLHDTGTRATLYLHPWDERALSCPEWEEFDGEWADALDGVGFRAAHPGLRPVVPCVTPDLTAQCEFLAAWDAFQQGQRGLLYRLQARAPDLRLDSLAAFNGSYAYLLSWAEQLARHDVTCAAYFPPPAYLSGRPYCAFATGDDLQYDCGRCDQLGQLMGLSFNGARFLWISNPHALGHCRRLGFTNGIYVPYPMDDSRYCPGEPHARQAWEAQRGPGFYVLTTARIDNAVKGNSGSLFEELIALARRCPSVRYVFLKWGRDAAAFAERVREAGLQDRFLLLSPVGKARLIDYYRSCDCVLDQFIYGYYGATGLEACSVGKPVVMRIREEHYSPLYGGDVAPVLNCRTAPEAAAAIEGLTGNPERCAELGQQARAWLQRHHGEAVTVPLMLALLRFTRDRCPLPPGLDNPLADAVNPEETVYHQSRLRPTA